MWLRVWNGRICRHQETGRREAQRLRIRFQQLKEDIAANENTANRGFVLSALDRCQQIQHDYPEFELSGTMRERATQLQAQIAKIDNKIKEAQALHAKGEKDKSRGIFAELAKDNLAFLMSRNVDLPVTVSSISRGSDHPHRRF